MHGHLELSILATSNTKMFNFKAEFPRKFEIDWVQRRDSLYLNLRQAERLIEGKRRKNR